MTMHTGNRHPGRPIAPAALAAGAGLILGACDFSVINPGDVQDPFLDDPGAHEAVVEGASYALSIANWQVIYHAEEASKQITRSGRNFCCPKVPGRVGEMERDALDNNTWNAAHTARFAAVDAIRRFSEVVDDGVDSYAPAARAQLYVGYSNRLLGENMCEAVLDGEAPADRSRHFEDAVAGFTQAIEIGQRTDQSDVVMAARAGRASVLGAGLGDWAAAAEDAEHVPMDFEFEAVYSASTSAQYNHIYDLGARNPWRDWTVWGTRFVEEYEATGDPRIAWVDREDDENPLGLPIFEQRKYTSRADNINLSSGREMLLVRAEAALQAENWPEAITHINTLRANTVSHHTDAPLAPLAAANAEEAWTHLKDERARELWLEGRRMADLRRWIGDGTNITPGLMEDMSDRVRLCFPVAQSEVNTNDHIPQGYNDPVNPIFTGN